jgi:diguanylate cyclase (GGDEF)-like protein
MSKGNGGRDWLVAYKKRIIIGIISILTFTIILTMFLVACTMRSRLLQESRERAQELGTLLHSSLSYLMEARDPDRMQQALTAVAKGDTTVVRVFVIDNRGKIAYSSRTADIGAVIDRFTDPSCTGCHSGPAVAPGRSNAVLSVNGQRVQRYVHLIGNEAVCHRCHPASEKLNGKLIIDRSMDPTDDMIGTIILIVSGLGIACLAVLVPFLWRFLSRGVNTYISEIHLKSAELHVLYSAVERLSATIELEGLKKIIIDIVSEALGADEVDMILPSEYKESGAMVWTKTGSVIERKKIERGSALQAAIQGWIEGRHADHEIAAGGREVRMPIAKSGNRLALIIIRSDRESFDPSRLPLVRAMANHIAVAFENAILYHLAITDELTGLYSNRHFRQTILKRYGAFDEYGEKTALLMVDIDLFKRINDTYGHPAGDTILRDVAKCVMMSIRDDDLAFRYGGEEFAVILPASDTQAGAAVAERMRALIEHYPFRVDGQVLQVTVSIGVSSWPASAGNVKDLIGEADQGLYDAKHGGRNRVVVRTKR